MGRWYRRPPHVGVRAVPETPEDDPHPGASGLVASDAVSDRAAARRRPAERARHRRGRRAAGALRRQRARRCAPSPGVEALHRPVPQPDGVHPARRSGGVAGRGRHQGSDRHRDRPVDQRDHGVRPGEPCGQRTGRIAGDARDDRSGSSRRPGERGRCQRTGPRRRGPVGGRGPGARGRPVRDDRVHLGRRVHADRRVGAIGEAGRGDPR